MSNMADLSTNSNPREVAVDSDGYARTRLAQRRETKEFSMSLLYVPKCNLWKLDLLDMAVDEFHVSLEIYLEKNTT